MPNQEFSEKLFEAHKARTKLGLALGLLLIVGCSYVIQRSIQQLNLLPEQRLEQLGAKQAGFSIFDFVFGTMDLAWPILIGLGCFTLYIVYCAQQTTVERIKKDAPDLTNNDIALTDPLYFLCEIVGRKKVVIACFFYLLIFSAFAFVLVTALRDLDLSFSEASATSESFHGSLQAFKVGAILRLFFVCAGVYFAPPLFLTIFKNTSCSEAVVKE